MILEWLSYVRTKSTSLAKDWGYVYQNVSLKFRARRCAKAWRPHVDECHNLIREELQKINPKTVMIIGSGLLLEIPIHDLLKSTEKIYLVDIIHAPEIRKLAKAHSQIELIEKDISSLLSVLKKGMAPFQPKNIPWQTLEPWDMPKVDWVISANLLSQIPLIISETLPMSSEVYKVFARHVRDQHIERLCQQGRKVLLFADFENRYIDRESNVIKVENYEVDLGPLKYLKEWIWLISPFGETSRDYKVEMSVKAYTK